MLSRIAGADQGLDPEDELARLRSEVQRLKAETAKLTTERDILRKAAKYFAGETTQVEPLPVRLRPPHHPRGEAAV